MSLRDQLNLCGSQILSVNPKRRDDPSARYIMPPLQLKFEGQGNGCRTIIENMHLVCGGILQRPEDSLMKHFSVELGTKANFVKKDDKYILYGFFEQERLQQLLDGFITKYVLCPNCENPETVLLLDDDEGKIKNKKKLRLATRCHSCGALCLISPAEKLYATLAMEVATAAMAAEALAKKQAKKQSNASGLTLISDVPPTVAPKAAPAHDEATSPSTVTDAAASSAVNATQQKVEVPQQVPPLLQEDSVPKTTPKVATEKKPPLQDISIDDMFAALDKKSKKEKKKKKTTEEQKSEEEKKESSSP